MPSRRIVPATEIDASQLEAFLSRFYSSAKAAFLRDHGGWWYRGEQNRWVILVDSELAGYCGLIPGRLLYSGEEVDVAWWIDLVVAPEFRGRGLQRVFDDKVKSAAPLIAGFPNSLAAKIHRRHGWGVHEDLRTLLMPLWPRRIRAVRCQGGLGGSVLRAVALTMEPMAALFRRRLEHWSGHGKVAKGQLDPSELERVFRTSSVTAGATTLRDESFIRWRYFDSPYLDDLEFFKAGAGTGSEIVAITRRKRQNEVLSVRVLDLFGATENRAILRQLMMAIGVEAVRQDAVQITTMASSRGARNALRSLGFLAASKTRFCWWSEQEDLMTGLARGGNHWVLADSDNDEP